MIFAAEGEGSCSHTRIFIFRCGVLKGVGAGRVVMPNV